MLVRLLYASRATDAASPDALARILAQSRANNPARGITGVLCASGRVFLQVLEGGRLPVNALYNRIAADPRHRDVAILSYEEIRERRFAQWSMGVVDLQRVNPSLLLRYSEAAALDPFAVPGAASLALLDELMASAAVIGQAAPPPSGPRLSAVP